ncbi:hypothetical protein HSR122_2064 [Halapricum desulfuricans]|uniref:Uncharacterized protein n=1 Tax=Halapricum desulfuricans TaxID=2841257 RepID=A0A897NAP6_9EURY|nr:hypothetical protein HSR122_2064 [Halapricum desulfuricans]
MRVGVRVISHECAPVGKRVTPISATPGEKSVPSLGSPARG